MDIWAVGVILYIMLVGEQPFTDDTDPNITYRNVIQGPGEVLAALPETVNKAENDLLSKLLQKDPLQRLSAESALQHPFFRMCKD